MQLHLPDIDWTQAVITLGTVIGAGGLVKMLQVYFEARRLQQKDYREPLERRIRELESDIQELQAEIATLREGRGFDRATNRALRAENAALREEVERLQGPSGDDERTP